MVNSGKLGFDMLGATDSRKIIGLARLGKMHVIVDHVIRASYRPNLQSRCPYISIGREKGHVEISSDCVVG